MSNKYLADGAPKRIVCRDREEWLAQRTGIGASEVGVIMGVSKWETPYQLWLRKTGQAEAKPMNSLMLAGSLLEDAVAQYFEIETGKKVIKASAGNIIYAHPEKDFLRVTPDRTYWIDADGRKSESNKGILECKTSQLTISPDDIPPQYFCQVQYQMGVMQKDHAALAWLTRGRDFGYTYISFNPEFFAYMVEQVEKFWTECVLGGREPELSSSSDVLLKYSSPETGKTVEAGDEILKAYTQLKEVRENRLRLEKEEDALTETLKVFCSDADTITYEGSVLATWKQGKDSSKFDKDAFARENPELYAKYVKVVGGGRRFSLK